jgi:hypothetical protein
MTQQTEFTGPVPMNPPVGGTLPPSNNIAMSEAPEQPPNNLSVPTDPRAIEARRANSERLGGATVFINNRSTRTISGFYLYGYDTRWTLRLRERIRPGGRGRISIPASGLPCTSHLMTNFSDGEAFNAGNVPLCPTSTINVGEPNEPNGD